MRPPSEQEAIAEVLRRLPELLGFPPSAAQIRSHPAVPQAAAVIQLGGLTFVVEWKGSSAVATVAATSRRVRDYASALDEEAIPLVAVPFMGPAGRGRCEEDNVAWLDLSGNAGIVAPGVRVRVVGEPNRFKHPGRPSSAFAPKSARIARWLLMHPHRSVTQREIARATGMDEGFTSRIVAKLEEDDLIVREPGGAIRPRDPDLLLDAWREDYDFSKHDVRRGHVPVRSGEALLRQVDTALRERNDRYAVTGLAAAWLLSRFAGFRIVTIYLAKPMAPVLLDRLGFRENAQGANTWLVLPNDEGVFQGAGDRAGIRCVHPVQVYLDLKGHPERADEGAEHLRSELLTWRSDA